MFSFFKKKKRRLNDRLILSSLNAPMSSSVSLPQASTSPSPILPATRSSQEGVRFFNHQTSIINYAPVPVDKIGHLQFIAGASEEINIGSNAINRVASGQEQGAQPGNSRASSGLSVSPTSFPAAVSFNQSSINTAHFYAAPSSLPQPLTLNWETLIACIKKHYLDNDKIKSTFDEAQLLERCYVNLAIVEEKEQEEKTRKLASNEIRREAWLHSYEALHGVKRSILPADIFRGEANQDLKKLLLLGRAGIGKSVLCQYLAYQWGKGTLWQEATFKLLLWIPLRFLIHDTESTLGKLIYERFTNKLEIQTASEEEKAHQINNINNLIRAHHSEVLYVLDGFDEVASILAKRSERGQTGIIETLLEQERVFITSRPYYIDHYLSAHGITIERRLENIGVIEENIHDYIQRYRWKVPEQGSALSEAIYQNSNLRGIAHIPINLALLCHHWRRLKVSERKGFNASMTSLYEGLVAGLLHERVKLNRELEVSSKSDPRIFEIKETQPLLRFLEKLAFLQMQDSALLIKKERLVGLVNEFEITYEAQWLDFKKVLELGLLVSSDKEEAHFELGREQYFIHLTFQEFFAARYLARLFKEEQAVKQSVAVLERREQGEKLYSQPLKKFLALHKYDLRYEIVWWFTAGLLKDHGSGLERFFKALRAKPRDISQSFEPLLWIKCLEECELKTTQKKLLIPEISERTKVLLKSLRLGTRSASFYSTQHYLKLWLDYLFSSSRVWEELSILKSQEELVAASKVLRDYNNLPPFLLTRYISLLEEGLEKENKEKIAAGQEALMLQRVLPLSIMQSIKGWLENSDIKLKKKALMVLARCKNLSEAVLRQVIKLWEEDRNDTIKEMAGKILGEQATLPQEIFPRVVQQLKDLDVSARRRALGILANKKNLAEDLLMPIMCLWEKDTDEDVKTAARLILQSQVKLLPDIFLEVVNFEHGNTKIKAEALNILKYCTHLDDTVLEQVVKIWEKEESEVKAAAQEVLMKHTLSSSVLHQVIKHLKNTDATAKESALKILIYKKKISKEVLGEVMWLWRNDLCTKVREAALWVLRETMLPSWLLNQLENLLSSEDNLVKNEVRTILMRQQHLSDHIIGRLLEDITTYKDDWLLEDVVWFIIHYMERIKNNSVLCLKLICMPELLAKVILKNNISGKGVAYFVDASFVITSGHQLISLTPQNWHFISFKNQVKLFLDYQVAHSLGYIDAETAYQNGRVKFNAKDYQGAINDFTEAMDSVHSATSGSFTIYCIARARANLLRKDYIQAENDAYQVITRMMENAEVYCVRAWARLLNGKDSEAQDDVTEALKLDKNLGETHCIQALIYLQQGNLTNAIDAAQQAVVLEEQGTALFILAQLYQLNGEKEAYQTTLLKAQEQDDNNPFFNLLEKWIMNVEKQHIEKNKRATQTAPIEKLETRVVSMSTFLPSYSAGQSSFASFNQDNNTQDKKEGKEVDEIVKKTASFTLKSSS